MHIWIGVLVGVFEGKRRAGVRDDVKFSFSNCPGCRASARLTDYGVDYTLYNAIAMVNLVDTKNEYRRDRMATMYS